MAEGVVIAGGGITGLEAALALRELVPDARVRLLAAGDRFVMLPAATALAFRPDLPVSAPLATLLQGTGVELEQGTLRAVDTVRRRLALEGGGGTGYDHLVVAVGARREPYLGAGALTFRGPEDAAAVRALIEQLVEAAAGGVRADIAFAVPPGPGWPLPAYELALLTAARLAAEGVRERVGVTLVTAEPAALSVFGPDAAEAVGRDLAGAGIALRCDAVIGRWTGSELTLMPGGRVRADRVVALPRVRGPGLAGLPADALDFVRADVDGRIAGTRDAWVVGDAGTFPIKQGGIGCDQADRAAALIARDLGAEVEVPATDPVLHAFLLEGLEERYLQSHPTGGHEDSPGRTWLLRMERMTGKVAGRHLAPFLERRMAQVRLRAVE